MYAGYAFIFARGEVGAGRTRGAWPGAVSWRAGGFGIRPREPGKGRAEGVFDDFVVLGGAEEDADGRSLVEFAHVAVEGFEVEFHLAEVLGFEFPDFQIESDETLKPPMEEKQVQTKILAADLKQVLLTHETEVAAQFEEEFLQIRDQAALETALVMDRRQVEEVEQVGVLEG